MTRELSTSPFLWGAQRNTRRESSGKQKRGRHMQASGHNVCICNVIFKFQPNQACQQDFFNIFSMLISSKICRCRFMHKRVRPHSPLKTRATRATDESVWRTHAGPHSQRELIGALPSDLTQQPSPGCGLRPPFLGPRIAPLG